MYLDKISPIGHLEIQDGDHYSKWEPFCIYRSGLVYYLFRTNPDL